jgi:O-antigen/teichoic acid export membrane protein
MTAADAPPSAAVRADAPAEGRAPRRRMPIAPGLEANALMLVLSSVSTGVLGMLYWLVAERFYPTHEIGQAAATISTATLLGSLACLSLGGSYQRFLPVSGERTRALIAGGLLLTGAVALALGTAFVALAPTGERLFARPSARVLFPLIVAAFTAYALLDPILTGLRRASAVAAKNITLSVLKIVPLPLLAATRSDLSISGSWALLALVIAGVVIARLLRGGLRSHMTQTSTLPPLRQLWAFQGASLAMAVTLTITPLCLPLIVLTQLGAEYNAYYALAATLVTATGMLRAGVLSSYVVEASAPGAPWAALTRRMLRLMAAATAVAVAALAIAGPVLLHLVGRDYADAATGLMLLMAVEALVGSVTAVYVALSQVSRKLRLLMAVQVITVAITLGAAVPLVRAHELLGLGLATLAAQLCAASLVAVPLARQLRAAWAS